VSRHYNVELFDNDSEVHARWLIEPNGNILEWDQKAHCYLKARGLTIEQAERLLYQVDEKLARIWAFRPAPLPAPAVTNDPFSTRE